MLPSHLATLVTYIVALPTKLTINPLPTLYFLAKHIFIPGETFISSWQISKSLSLLG